MSRMLSLSPNASWTTTTPGNGPVPSGTARYEVPSGSAFIASVCAGSCTGGKGPEVSMGCGQVFESPQWLGERMLAAADVGQSVVAGLLGLGAAGVAGAVVAMAWSVHIHQIQLARHLARHEAAGPEEEAV